MLSKKKLLKRCRLYLILDREVNSYKQLFEIAKRAIKAGVDIIQLRDKKGKAKDILKFSKKLAAISKDKAIFIVNDRLDIAAAAGSSGVHLGQEDIPLVEARKILGKNFIIGVSCQTLSQAKLAEKQGADYIGLGSVFKTLTKPERSDMEVSKLKRILKSIKIPIFTIGGIRLDAVDKLKGYGVERMAVCRAICLSKNVEDAARDFKQAIIL